MFPLLQSLGTLLDCHDFSDVMESSLATMSAGPWDASHQVPWSSVYSGGLEPDLLLQWVGIHSPSPCLEIQGLERCGKGSYQ